MKPSYPTQKPLKILKDWITLAANQMEWAKVNLENGLQKPYLEAEWLARRALTRCFEAQARQSNAQQAALSWKQQLQQPPPPQFSAIFADFLAQRIKERLPAAYIVGEAPFAGHLFAVNSSVLIPRSRIENLLEDPRTLSQWLKMKSLPHILDLCTGSGCLAIAFALAFPEAHVDATDISSDALLVAATNRSRFKLDERMELIHSHLFERLAGRRYNLIVTNPPYVCQASMASLPAEYCHEPALALDGGIDGLTLVEPILRQAAQFLTPHGMLICEVGDETEEIMRKRWPNLPVEWLNFHFGGSGVFAARRADLAQWAAKTS